MMPIAERGWWLGMAIAAAVSCPAVAQRPAGVPTNGAAGSDPAGVALVDAFGRFCFQRFPQPARMEDVAPGHVSALPQAAVREYLHDDPGHAWRYEANGAAYIVTVEDPPYHTCAVRSLYRAVPQYRLPWLLATELWATQSGRGAFANGGSPQTVDGKDMRIEASSRLLPGAGGDVLMEITTTYRDGRVEQRLARRALEGAHP